VRALVDGGFADMHHPEYWDLGFAAREVADAYRRIIDSISDSLDFYAAISGSPVHEASQALFLREPRRTAPAL
jgi:3-deoxy-7-phosphoheptulonate synthase